MNANKGYYHWSSIEKRWDEMRIEKVLRMVEWKRWELRRWMASIIKNGQMVEWKR